jgi:hypothetical protein
MLRLDIKGQASSGPFISNLIGFSNQLIEDEAKLIDHYQIEFKSTLKLTQAVCLKQLQDISNQRMTGLPSTLN